MICRLVVMLVGTRGLGVVRRGLVVVVVVVVVRGWWRVLWVLKVGRWSLRVSGRRVRLGLSGFW